MSKTAINLCRISKYIAQNSTGFSVNNLLWLEVGSLGFCLTDAQLSLSTLSYRVSVLNWTRRSGIAVIADRTACSILTLFIVIATSRPLNKKIRSLSVRGSNNYWGSAALTWTARARAAWVCHCWQTSRALSTCMPHVAWFHRHLWRYSLRFLWCILWLNDKSYSKSVWRDK